MADIETIVMPKWGLAMQEGMLAQWHVEEGQDVTKGQEIADIETSKIANVFESPITGHLRRRLVQDGETVLVGALLAVCAPSSVPDAEVESFIAAFQEKFAAEAEAAAAAGGGPEPETIEAGGRKLRFLKLGSAEGPPVIFVHGFGGDLNNWLFNQEKLAETHTTYAVDLPGHGGSTKEVGKADVGALAAAVVDFMGAIGAEKAHLVGHSLGGGVCLAIALDHPEKAASVTMLAPAGLGPDISMEYIDGFIGASRAKKLKPVLEMLVANPDLVTRDMVEDVLKFKRMDGVADALNAISTAAFAGGRQTLSLAPRLGELKVPAQIIWGRKDRVLPSSQAEAAPTSVKVTVLDDAGHLVHMEKAAEVNELIAALAG